MFFHIYAKEITGKMLKNFCIYIIPPIFCFVDLFFQDFIFWGFKNFEPCRDCWMNDRSPSAVVVKPTRKLDRGTYANH